MTQEEMIQAWKDTNRRLEKLEREMGHGDRRGPLMQKRRTALDDLARRYKTFAIIGMIFIPVMFAFYNRLFPEVANKWTAWLFCVYFGTVSCMDWWLFSKVRSIDVVGMNAEEVARRAAYCKKRHHLFMAILIPMMLIVMIFFIYSIRMDYVLIQGAVIGACFGIYGGIRQYRNFMADYRMLIGESSEK